MPSVASSKKQQRRMAHRLKSLSNKESNHKGQSAGTGMTDLSIEIPSAVLESMGQRDEDRYDIESRSSQEERSLEEGAAEEWLTSPIVFSRNKKDRKEMLFAESAAQVRRRAYEDYESPVNRCYDARSSVSSPGNTLFRDRLRRELLKEELRKKMKRSGALQEVDAEQDHDENNSQAATRAGDARVTFRFDSDIAFSENKQNAEGLPEDQVDDSPQQMNGQVTTSDADGAKDEPVSFPLEQPPPPPPSSQTNQCKKSAKKEKQVEDSILLRLSRQVRLGRKGGLPHTKQVRRANNVTMHVYDLIAKETIMLLPFGCDFPIGKFFNCLNSGLHSLGTGAYHVGVEVSHLGVSLRKIIMGAFLIKSTAVSGEWCGIRLWCKQHRRKLRGFFLFAKVFARFPVQDFHQLWRT
jgi:hypothetical protein